ncbi:ABC transporter permease [Saliphagus sp. LR7]|uniref:ABC transporter permease n=1 Tax=Saliphagus sp. LR7 TaxID=2282654 RepID=UPI000DF7A7F0|nr:ABC transporter permease [Saliphagus sp. LR7]
MTDQEASIFQTESDVQWSKKQRLKWRLEAWVIEPGRVLIKDFRGVVGIAIVGLFLAMGTVGIALLPEPSPTGPILLEPFQQTEYILGTDKRGFSILTSIVYATPNMFKMIFAGAIFATGVATAVGTLAGYKGGVWDSVLSTLSDIALTIPGLPLVIVIGFVYQPTNPYVVGILVTVNAWGGLARAIRSQVLTIRNEVYVERSRALGLSTPKIIRNDVLPGILPYVSVNFVNTARGVIFNAVALYFLGILPFTHLNWGVMLNQAYQNGALFNPGQIHWLIIPTFTIVLLSFGFLLLAQAFDRVFNPRARTRHDETEDTEEPTSGPTTSIQ